MGAVRAGWWNSTPPSDRTSYSRRARVALPGGRMSVLEVPRHVGDLRAEVAVHHLAGLGIGHGGGKQVSLGQRATEAHEANELVTRLDALSEHRDIQVETQGHDGL